ncbi:MAG: hypothetical protein WC466_05390 [Candidatus Izemoplasmatales bacterium]
MVLLVLLATLVVAACFFFWLGSRNDYNEHAITGCVLLFFSAIGIIITIALNVDSYNKQVLLLEKIKRADEKIQLYEERADQISSVLSDILIENYQEYEKDVFENMSSKEGIELYFLKYPELNTHATFISYSETYKELMDSIYSQKMEKIDLQIQINTGKRRPEILQFILPEE